MDEASAGLLSALAEAKSAWPGIQAERYLTVAGTSILIWDWMLLFERERELIWGKKPWTLTRVSYIVVRYLVMASQVLVLFAIGGYAHSVPNSFCRAWYIYLVVTSLSCLSLANWALITWVYALWDHRTWVLRVLMIAFSSTYAMVVIFDLYATSQIFGSIEFEGQIFHMCLFTKRPMTYTGVWAAQVGFDVFLGFMTVMNAADRPRTVDVKLITNLLRDGSLLYGILFGLRLMNLILCFVNNIAFTVMGLFFDWAIVTVVITRLLLRLEDMKLPRGERRHNGDSTFANEVELYIVPHADIEEDGVNEQRARSN